MFRAFFEHILSLANARRFKLERLKSCEKGSASVSCANKGLCPFESCKPFFEGLDPKIYCFFLPKPYQKTVKKV